MGGSGVGARARGGGHLIEEQARGVRDQTDLSIWHRVQAACSPTARQLYFRIFQLSNVAAHVDTLLGRAGQGQVESGSVKLRRANSLCSKLANRPLRHFGEPQRRVFLINKTNHSLLLRCTYCATE